MIPRLKPLSVKDFLALLASAAFEASNNNPSPERFASDEGCGIWGDELYFLRGCILTLRA